MEPQAGISNGLLQALPQEVLKGWHFILARCLALRALPHSFVLGHIYTMPKGWGAISAELPAYLPHGMLPEGAHPHSE
jgi:hypothetical protein